MTAVVVRVGIGVWAAAVVAGCASRAVHGPQEEPTVPSFEQRLATNPEWQPGDPEPVAIERVRFADAADPEASTRPMEFITVVRNRCEEPIAFAVGPQDGPGQGSPPLHEVPALSAASVWVHELDWFFVRLPRDEAWHRAQAPSGHIIVEGAGCDDVVVVQR